MADKKITQLPASTTPLAGTEVLPIVQSGQTVKISVDNLTAGKTVNASKLQATSNILNNTTTATGVGEVKFNNATTLLATNGSITTVGSIASTQKVAAANNATTDAFRFLQTDNSTVYGTSWQCGIFYVNVNGASGANQYAASFAYVSMGNGAGNASITQLQALTRGTSPVSSVQLASDGSGGAVKLTITYINDSGVVTGGESNVTFIGQSSLT